MSSGPNGNTNVKSNEDNTTKHIKSTNSKSTMGSDLTRPNQMESGSLNNRTASVSNSLWSITPNLRNLNVPNELELLNNLDTEEVTIDLKNNERFHPKYFLKVIAFDLDKTMVRTISLRTKEQPQQEQFKNGYFMFYDDETGEFHHVYKRPHLSELLQFLQRVVKEQYNVTLILSTHGTEKYAQTILKRCGASDLFAMMMPRQDWHRRQFENDYKTRRFKTIARMAERCDCTVEDLLMIDDDPAVYGHVDRCQGSLIHIKPFEDPTIQSDDKELLKLKICLHNILQYGKNYYNHLLCSSIIYTGLINEYTIAETRRQKQQTQTQIQTQTQTKDSLLDSPSKKDVKDSTEKNNLVKLSSNTLYLRDRLFRMYFTYLYLYVLLWCLRWEFGIEMNPQERLGTLYLFDRFHREKKIDWRKAELHFSLHEFIISMFGCLPKQFRRDPYSCELWLYHVDLYQTIITRLTEKRIAFLEKLQQQCGSVDHDSSTCSDPSNTNVLDQYHHGLDSLHYPVPLIHQRRAHLSNDDGDVEMDDYLKPQKQPDEDVSMVINEVDEQETIDDSGNRTGGEEEDEDELDKKEQSSHAPLSIKDAPEDHSILPHDKNPFIDAHLKHEQESL
ncbi:hypothetical protein RFI_16253, partial [Reticulomyxa filosa]